MSATVKTITGEISYIKDFERTNLSRILKKKMQVTLSNSKDQKNVQIIGVFVG